MRPPSPRRSCGERYHDADMTEGVTEVATEGAMEGAIEGADSDSVLAMLSRDVGRTTSVASDSASESSLLAIETSYRVGSEGALALWWRPWP